MKNIEKYPKTKGALDAYNALDSKTVSFDTWLECEFEEPRVPTLLEAAQEVVKTKTSSRPGAEELRACPEKSVLIMIYRRWRVV